MRTHKFRALLALMFALAFCEACSAAGRSFLDSLPATHMTPEDHNIAMAAINSALDEGQSGTSYRWENPATGASGSITPKQSFSQAGMNCRGAEIVVSAGGKTNANTWKLCKTPEGWKVLE